MTPRPLQPREVPPGTPDRIFTMMTSGQAAPVITDPAKVSALWKKALRSLRSSRAPEIDADTAVDAAYKALLQASMALLESEGYRVGSATGGHHYLTFRAVTGLGYPALDHLDEDTEFVRRLRASAVYEPEEASASDLGRIQQLAVTVLPAIRAAIAARRPALSRALGSP